MPLSALLLQYAIPLVFLLILVDCWRTPNLLPLFGSVRTARIAWSLAIITANPFLLVVYLVVARKQWWTTQREQRRDRVLLACIGASVLLQIPFGQSDYKKVVLPNGESISSWGLAGKSMAACLTCDIFQEVMKEEEREFVMRWRKPERPSKPDPRLAGLDEQDHL